MNQAVKLDTNPSLALVAQLEFSELAAGQKKKLKLSTVHPKFEVWSCYHFPSSGYWITTELAWEGRELCVYLYQTVVESTSVLPLSTKESSE